MTDGRRDVRVVSVRVVISVLWDIVMFVLDHHHARRPRLEQDTSNTLHAELSLGYPYHRIHTLKTSQYDDLVKYSASSAFPSLPEDN